MRFILPLIGALALSACGNKGAPSASTDLDKATAVKQLETMLNLIETKKFDGLMDIMAAPKGKEGELKEMLPKIAPGLIAKKEISAAGIKIIAEKGTFGPLAEVFPKKGQRWAERYGVKVEDCKGLSYKDGEAGFCKLDGKWKLVRVDDIGKLE